VKTIVASHNPDLARDFDRDLLRRRDLRLVTARDTRELVEKLREGAHICFVDRMLPDGDAEAALSDIRADRHLIHIPVVLVTAIGAPQLDRAEAQKAGFADVVVLPTSPGALSLLIARLLGLPLREDERFAVRVHVFSDDPLRKDLSDNVDSPETYIGTSIDLSENGMLLKARKRVPAGTMLGVRFSLPGRAGELALRSRVVRIDSETFFPAHALALAFEDVTAADAAALREYLRVLLGGRPFHWRVVEPGESGGRRVIELMGVLRADSDLSGLPREHGEQWFRMREFRRISSDSVQKWIDFARAQAADARLHLVECPVPFIHLANLIPSLLEHQMVVSFYAPYSCAACGLDEERLIDVHGDLADGKRRQPPEMRCSGCGGLMAFDELPEFFAFLDR
jgi:CheY-like chemotaxis protein